MTAAIALTFIHISDTHIHKDPRYTGDFVSFTSRRPVAELVQQINALPFKVDFVLHTGDIMTDPEHDLDYVVARELLEAIRFPVHYVVGNHDRTGGVQRVLLGQEDGTLQARLDYEIAHEGVQVICLDSTLAGSAAGHLHDSQLKWLDGRLNADDPRPLVVALHHHPIPCGAPWLDELVLKNGLALHEVLLKVRQRVRGVFYGHIHENMTTTRDGISYYSVRSAWFQTRTWPGQTSPVNDPHHDPGFNVVTITDKDTFVRRYRFHVPG